MELTLERAPRPAHSDALHSPLPGSPQPVRPDGGSHAVGLGVVVAVHVVVGYALLSGLAQKVVDTVRAPIEARLIDEIKPPPPPPPPPEPPKIVPKQLPKLAAPPPPPFVPPPEVVVAAPPAPTIAVVAKEPPPRPVEIAPPPPPPAPPAPAPVVAATPPPPKAEPVAIGVACPTMVRPTLPRRAEQEGLGGTVRAQATIRGGKVVQVDILASKPRGLFDASVRNAMLQYGCTTTGADEIVAIQTFEFKAAD